MVGWLDGWVRLSRSPVQRLCGLPATDMYGTARRGITSLSFRGEKQTLPKQKKSYTEEFYLIVCALTGRGSPNISTEAS